jgi:uncharacterized protein (TIGR03000 family)
MLRKSWLAPLVLSVAGLLVIADHADAQRYVPGMGGARGWGNPQGSRVYDGYRSSGTYSSSYYSSGYYPSTTDLAAPQPATSFYYAPPTQTSDNADIRVIVPNPQARVWFDNYLTQQTGANRLFHTPPLSTSAANTYRVRAAWMEGDREVRRDRVINVSPGGSVLVDFTQSNEHQP